MQITSIDQLSKQQIKQLIKRALAFKAGATAAYPEHSAATLFFEPYTRTLMSFQKAAANLKMPYFNLDLAQSSLQKGETLEDTIVNLEAMEIKHFIIRKTEETFFKHFKFKHSLINAGDGTSNHPSQALLDAMTIYEHFQRLNNLKVLIVGDIKYSRVYHSNKVLLEKFASVVDSCGPEIFGGSGQNLAQKISQYDVIIMLRIQHERHNFAYDTKTYNQKWGLNAQNLKLVKPGSIILHPGPVNYGAEIELPNFENNPMNKIITQVKNGVYMRMAMLEELCKNI